MKMRSWKEFSSIQSLKEQLTEIMNMLLPISTIIVYKDKELC